MRTIVSEEPRLIRQGFPSFVVSEAVRDLAIVVRPRMISKRIFVRPAGDEFGSD
jgi:hypothetical protein